MVPENCGSMPGWHRLLSEFKVRHGSNSGYCREVAVEIIHGPFTSIPGPTGPDGRVAGAAATTPAPKQSTIDSYADSFTRTRVPPFIG